MTISRIKKIIFFCFTFFFRPFYIVRIILYHDCIAIRQIIAIKCFFCALISTPNVPGLITVYKLFSLRHVLHDRKFRLCYNRFFIFDPSASSITVYLTVSTAFYCFVTAAARTGSIWIFACNTASFIRRYLFLRRWLRRRNRLFLFLCLLC